MAAKDDKTEQVDDGLLTMLKLGCSPIKVHPTQVGPWEAQGWTVKLTEEV